MKSQHPTPVTTPLNQEQVDRARAGQFVLQRCTHDATTWYPPSTHCPSCLGMEYTWEPASGHATLWSWVVIHQPYLKAFSDELPYLVVLVELAEGPLLISTIVGTNHSALEIDQPLALEFDSYGTEEIPMPVFRLAATP